MLENLPRGSRVAYDVHSGRLWMVCRSCRRWSLIPLESRWEALEELEALLSPGSDASRRGLPRPLLLAKTARISLFRAGPLEIVQVGGAGLSEEALWRYGYSAEQGRVRFRGLQRILERRRLGTIAWRGHRTCPECGHVFTELSFSDRKILILTPDESEAVGDDTLLVSRRCPRCRDAHQGGLHLKGIEAGFVLRRVMAFERPTGVSPERVRAAVNIIEETGGPSALIRLLTRHGRPLGGLPSIGSMAVEILGNHARERALLQLEMTGLEARWLEEEELAALVDGELTSVPFLDTLVKRFRD